MVVALCVGTRGGVATCVGTLGCGAMGVGTLGCGAVGVGTLGGGTGSVGTLGGGAGVDAMVVEVGGAAGGAVARRRSWAICTYAFVTLEP